MKRIILIGSAFIALAGCNEATSDQTNNAAATTAAAPAASAVAPIDLSAVPAGEAKAVMEARHEGMKAIGQAMKSLSRELKAPSANMATVRSAAATLNDNAQKASGWFRAGTGPDVGKTGAKAEIWQKPQDFTAKLHDFQIAAQGMVNASADTDAGSAKAAFDNLGKSCKACHDSYRTDMHH